MKKRVTVTDSRLRTPAVRVRLAGIGDCHRSRAAFTIVELLIVVGLIILLLSILVVALRAATSTSQKASTTALMSSMKSGLVQFESDIGYLPPLLDPDRNLLAQPDPASGSFADDLQDSFSWTTLAEYVLGYGHHGQDGYGVIPASQGGPLWTDETPATGIRNPGADGVWGATVFGASNGALADRMQSGGANIDSGRVYGPYIEVSDPRLVASTDGTVDADGNLNVFFPGEAGYDDTAAKVICDYWGTPMRYYRRINVPGGLSTFDRRSFLSDVFVLRPWDVKGDTVDGLPDNGVNGDTTATYALKTAGFAIFSAGPDRTLNPDLRIDDPTDAGNTLGTDLANQDNLVELGP